MADHAQWSDTPWVTVGVYVVLLVILVLLTVDHSLPEYGGLFLMALLMVYLARMLSLNYSIRAGEVHASRLFGSRRAPVKEVRKVEPRSLRDLSPVSFIGGWGWRSRMWSPQIGSFDNLSSFHKGLMIYAGDVPFFISPKDPDAFLAALQEATGERLVPD